MPKRNAMTTLTRWVLGHKKLVVALWVVLTVAGVAALGPADRSFEQQFNLPGEEAFVANSHIVETYGNGGDAAPLVPVVSLPEGKTVDSPGVQADLAGALQKIAAAVPGSRVASYTSTHDRTSSPGTAGRRSLSSTSRARAASIPARQRRARRRRPSRA